MRPQNDLQTKLLTISTTLLPPNFMQLLQLQPEYHFLQ